MHNISASEAQKTDALLKSSYFIGLSETVLDELSQGTALRSFERGEVLFWEGDPCAGLHVIQNLTRNLRMLVGLVEELSFYQVTNRLARLISQLPRQQPGSLSAQRITQDQLAARLGTVREVVARSLRELERSGAIQVENRQIQIVDPEMLQDWAQIPCS